jgi:hypothetical protein
MIDSYVLSGNVAILGRSAPAGAIARSSKASPGRSRAMLFWWRRRKERKQQVIGDADNLMALYGERAYSAALARARR